MKRLVIAGLAAFALAGCASQAKTVATDTATATSDVSKGVTYADEALTVAEAALNAYKLTANPNKNVIAEAEKLDAEARAAIGQYGPEASTAISAVGALAEYLLTSAPGNGVTPSTVPTAASAS
jgi:type IV pilus biogenesis protein CpaD/CtpE